MEQEKRKELIKAFREKAKSGYTSRPDMLAYAFLREKPYVKLEAKINEDKIVESNRQYKTGLFCFLNGLARQTARKIFDVTTRISIESLHDDVYEWILQKYPESPEKSETSDKTEERVA